MPDYKKMVRKKATARKVNQSGMRSKKIPNQMLVPLLVSVLVVGAFFGIRYFLLHLPGFKINKVSVVDTRGKQLSYPEAVFNLENLKGKENLFKFDIKRVAQDIQARHPEFASVSVRRRFPDTLLITVKPKVAVAVVGLNRPCLVDEQGFILPFESASADLPKIAGIHPRQIQLYRECQSLRLKKALDLLEQLKQAQVHPSYKVSQIDVRQHSNVVFYLENGIQVKMGQSEFARKATVLKGILAQLNTAEAVPKYIDMRFDNPAVLP